MDVIVKLVIFRFTVPQSDPPLVESWPSARQFDVAPASDIDLHYKLFLVHVELIVSGVAFMTPEGSATFVNMALGAAGTARRLESGLPGGLGFTENPEVIEFRPAGDQVSVSSSVLPLSATADKDEVIAALRLFATEAYRVLVSHSPALRDNETLAPLRFPEDL
ncbi:hypothetical protein [Actinoplanes sp. L3-i22]|uniref:hypothetical protein n=1 Tax=Actinoplanes sp. L3-i22 TaxID=2836373 RepID=UPI001C77C403|nr:hypothetical protein [Actinoplanes sp. L3-i22]BCY08781.1 hypothetical protein L3i22_038690 [Actinoplanes sp. L3-i22]